MSATGTKALSESQRASSHRLEQAGASDASITNVHVQLLREKPEPTEGFSPIPIFILFVFSGLIFVGGIYMGTKSGEFSPLAFNVARGPVVESTAPKEVDMMKLGARNYNVCVACHQQSGQGMPGIYPPLAGSEFVTGDEERLIKIVAHGLTGPITVGGVSFPGTVQMPAHFGPASAVKFNDQKLAAVLTYIRATWGNSAPPVTPAKVKEVLDAVGARTKPWTVEELGGN